MPLESGMDAKVAKMRSRPAVCCAGLELKFKNPGHELIGPKLIGPSAVKSMKRYFGLTP